MKSLLCSVLFLVTAAGCTTLDTVRTDNRQSLNRLTIGMTKEEVLKTMGREVRNTYSNSGWSMFILIPPFPDDKINNPFRTEIVKSDSGTCEVLFYYTDRKASDNAITNDELTPLFIRDGKLIGWGWSYPDGVRLGLTIP